MTRLSCTLATCVWVALLFDLTLGILLESRSISYLNNSHFDYVILGGGTAGLVVASRLSENPEITVAVIEAGNFERDNPNVTSTTGLGIAKNTRIDWQYDTAPVQFADNQTRIYSAGKGLGGSSLINGMTYMRPTDSQVNLWSELGLELDWGTLFNFSKKGEHFQFPSSNLTALGASYQTSDHGFEGPLSTCISPHMTTSNIRELFNTTFQTLGVPPRSEFNGGELRGYGIQMVHQDGLADVREDAARAYYYPFMNRSNLLVVINSTATQIVWSQNSADGSAVASGAQFVGPDGSVSTVCADKDVILSAGALRSPAILENSGVGNPSILSQQSIDIKINLPSVGENLQDQTTMAILASSSQNTTGFPVFVAHTSLQDLFGSSTESLYNATLSKLPEYAATIAGHNGGASNASTQAYLLQTQLDLLYRSNTPASEIVPLGIANAIGAVFWPLEPFSRGSVHINSTDKTLQPRIDTRFLEVEFDVTVAVATARFVRKFLTTPPLVDIINVSSITPSFETLPEDASDEMWSNWVRTESSFQPNYHHQGTCAMLPREMGGVVDNDFRVYGTKNVRVVDLSIVPLQVAGHSTALLYGLAEWASEKIAIH